MKRRHTVTGSTTTPESTQRRWAPWWVYVIIILGANYLRQAVMPFGTVPEWAVVIIALTLAGILFVLITAIYRVVLRR
jgi:hypothetical protein